MFTSVARTNSVHAHRHIETLRVRINRVAFARAHLLARLTFTFEFASLSSVSRRRTHCIGATRAIESSGAISFNLCQWLCEHFGSWQIARLRSAELAFDRFKVVYICMQTRKVCTDFDDKFECWFCVLARLRPSCSSERSDKEVRETEEKSFVLRLIGVAKLSFALEMQRKIRWDATGSESNPSLNSNSSRWHSM